MSVSRSELLRWQFELVWALFEYHLERLRADDFLWEPAARCWTVRRTEDGGWEPDWAETEPEPVPVPTIAWVSWHVCWWWSVALDHLRKRPPRERADVRWPGDGEPAVAGLRELRREWLEVLDGLSDADLDAVSAFPWPEDAGHTVAHMIGWVNAELMKNAAEIGQVRMLRSAGATGSAPSATG